jgi:hypothetical protein
MLVDSGIRASDVHLMLVVHLSDVDVVANVVQGWAKVYGFSSRGCQILLSFFDQWTSWLHEQ